MTGCENSVPDTDLLCGQKVGFYCSKECASSAGLSELAELGITPEMMKEALDGYYECSEMIGRKVLDKPQSAKLPGKQSLPPYESDRG